MAIERQRVSPPLRPVPEGACDCRAHVFGPYDCYPLAGDRSYTPPEADADEYGAMLGTLGMQRGILVHPSAYGMDHRVTLDAIARDPVNRRGVGLATADTPDATLAALAAGGIRALRFTQMMKDGQPMKGSIGFDHLDALAPRIVDQGFHIQVFAMLPDIVANARRLLAPGVPVVIDHMGRFGPPAPRVDHPDFRTLLDLVRGGQVWVKLTMFRNSLMQVDFDDVRPYHDALIEAAPGRMLWGSDWPVLGYDPRLDVGLLLRRLDEWIGHDDNLRRRILVVNPAKLFGF